MKRRDFLKYSLQLSCLPLLQGHLPANFALENFQVLWLHIEGAPVREVFDFWADPLNQFNVKSLSAGQRPLKLKRGSYQLPNIWHDLPQRSKAIDHWLSVRGISLKGPHLKQARREWFRDDEDIQKSIFQNFNQEFSKANLEEAEFLALDSQTKEIYSPLIKQEINYLQNDSAPLTRLFEHWKNTSKTHCPLSAAVIRGPMRDGGKLFEEFDRWDEKTIKIHEEFFGELLRHIEELTHYLDKRGRFKHTALIITSDRRKAPTEESSNPPLEPVWEGGHFSLISGALEGPVILGDIYRDHPKYSRSYPMTWGSSNQKFGPNQVHKLIMDLCLAETRLRHYNPVEENPWAVPRSLQGLFIKGLPGRVI